MITVHHLKLSRSTRIIWLVEELGVRYDLVQYDRDRTTFRAPPELAKVHPLGKAPCVAVDGKVIGESGAIIEYLVERFDPAGTLTPPADCRADYLEWLHFAEGTLAMPMILTALAPRFKLEGPIMGYVQGEVTKQLDVVEAHLADRDYLLGTQFTGADINLEYMLEHAANAGALATRPNLGGYLARLQARPAYARAIALGGPMMVPRA
jgi:glutathione S-transferase